MKKAEMARQLGISRAYITMLTKGERQPSKKLSRKIELLTGKCSLSDSSRLLHTQRVTGSSPELPTISEKDISLY